MAGGGGRTLDGRPELAGLARDGVFISLQYNGNHDSHHYRFAVASARKRRKGLGIPVRLGLPPRARRRERRNRFARDLLRSNHCEWWMTIESREVVQPGQARDNDGNAGIGCS